MAVNKNALKLLSFQPGIDIKEWVHAILMGHVWTRLFNRSFYTPPPSRISSHRCACFRAHPVRNGNFHRYSIIRDGTKFCFRRITLFSRISIGAPTLA